MAQLVGQMCVVCLSRIGNELDARFCPSCRCPVHTACSVAAAAEKTAGGCPSCGAAAVEVAPRREDAEQEATRQAGSKQRRRGVVVMVASVGLMLLGLMQFAMAGVRQANDGRDQFFNRLDDGLGTVGAGLVGFLIGVRQFSKSS